LSDLPVGQKLRGGNRSFKLRALRSRRRDHREAFDLIVSADTLVYFGDLQDVAAAFAGALRPNGHLVFTLEHAAGDGADAGYRLELHGRYSHTRAYAKQLLASAGLPSKIIPAELRMEAGAPVSGLVICAAKPVSAP
jgi:predicted TPR repeat methyltransferase